MTIDTEELFRFLAQFDDYPTNGLRLAIDAKNRGCSDSLIHFFNYLPGDINDEADITKAALTASTPPEGMVVDALDDHKKG
jgi:hypothetical protein